MAKTTSFTMSQELAVTTQLINQPQASVKKGRPAVKKEEDVWWVPDPILAFLSTLPRHVEGNMVENMQWCYRCCVLCSFLMDPLHLAV